MMLPNVIIAGAPKCGSSSLFQWLSDHPDVCGSSIKETRYFLDPEFPGIRPLSNYHVHGMKGYEEYFDHCTDGRKIILEATPSYLYQRTALESLPGLRSSPSFIFVLRNPSERVYSLYNFAKNNTADIDSNVSFKKFLMEVREGNKGGYSDAPILRDALKHSRYADYLEQWIRAVGTDRVVVLLLDDMKKDPLGFMIEIANRLNIDPGFYENYGFEIRMKTVRIRNQMTHRVLRSVFGQKYKTTRFNPVPIRSLRDFLKKVYLMINSSHKKEDKSEEDLLEIAELDKEFAASKEKLAGMTGKDLSSWM